MRVDQENAGVKALRALRLAKNFDVAFNAAHAAAVDQMKNLHIAPARFVTEGA